MSDPDGWTRNKITLRVPAYMAALDHPWLLPDPNPFPQMQLFTLRRKAKLGIARDRDVPESVPSRKHSRTSLREDAS